MLGWFLAGFVLGLMPAALRSILAGWRRGRPVPGWKSAERKQMLVKSGDL